MCHLCMMPTLNRMASVPSIPVAVDETNIQSGAKDILRIVRPKWFPYMKGNNAELKSKVFTEGLSNKLVGFYIDENPEDMVIIKVFGTNTDVMIDRKAEIETMRLLHERKCGAELYATFDNGICYEYVNGVTLEISDCDNPEVYPLVAAEMAHMHAGLRDNSTSSHDDSSTIPHHVNGNGHSHDDDDSEESQGQCPLWSKLEQLGNLAEECLENDTELKERLQLSPRWTSEAVMELRYLLEPKKMPVTFCHNDLIPRNIVYDKKRQRVTFIDVEYAMPNYPAFDVANHFLEFAGLAEEMDYSKCPDKTFRLKWLNEYLPALKAGSPQMSEVTVEEFNHWVDLCTPASHLFWSLWGIYQAKHSTIQFDYVKYVRVRAAEFRKCMDQLKVSLG